MSGGYDISGILSVLGTEIWTLVAAQVPICALAWYSLEDHRALAGTNFATTWAQNASEAQIAYGSSGLGHTRPMKKLDQSMLPWMGGGLLRSKGHSCGIGS